MDMTEKLDVNLFGDVELKLGSHSLPHFPTRKSSSLFSRLILNAGHYFTRDTLAELIWKGCEPGKSRKCLRTELWRIRKIIEPDGIAPGTFLKTSHAEVGFNADANYNLDVAVFEKNLSGLIQCSPEEIRQNEYLKIKECLALYRGDFLETLDDDWCVLQRESLRSKYLMAIEFLMQYHKNRQEWAPAINYARDLLSHDPLLEHIHVELMSLYFMQGNRPAALQQFSNCRNVLREELGISPMERTVQVYREIIASRKQPDSSGFMGDYADASVLTSTPKVKIDEALTHVQSVEKLLRAANQQLTQN